MDHGKNWCGIPYFSCQRFIGHLSDGSQAVFLGNEVRREKTKSASEIDCFLYLNLNSLLDIMADS